MNPGLFTLVLLVVALIFAGTTAAVFSHKSSPVQQKSSTNDLCTFYRGWSVANSERVQRLEELCR